MLLLGFVVEPSSETLQGAVVPISDCLCPLGVTTPRYYLQLLLAAHQPLLISIANQSYCSP